MTVTADAVGPRAEKRCDCEVGMCTHRKDCRQLAVSQVEVQSEDPRPLATISEDEIERTAQAIEASMFAPHELPLSAELHLKYRATAIAAISAMPTPSAAQEAKEPPAGLVEGIAQKLKHPIFQGLRWETYDAYLPLKFVGPCSVTDWYAKTPNDKEIIVSAADKRDCITLHDAIAPEASTVPSAHRGSAE